VLNGITPILPDGYRGGEMNNTRGIMNFDEPENYYLISKYRI